MKSDDTNSVVEGTRFKQVLDKDTELYLPCQSNYKFNGRGVEALGVGEFSEMYGSY